MATTKATTLAHTIASTTSSTADLDYAKTLNDTGVTSTEFDKLDGLTATTTELNKLSGVTATTDELNLVDGSVTGPLSHRNMIINGAMQVAQRGNQFTGVHFDQFITDRFLFSSYGEDELRVTCEQSSTAPNDQGFNNSLLVNCTTAEASWSAHAYARLAYIFESQDLQQLRYGTPNAQTITLSFWVKSSLPGTYAVSMYQYDGNDTIGGTYTISSSTDWEKKTLTFAGNTVATIANDNTAGISLLFVLATGGNYSGTDNTSWGEYSSAKAHHGHTANWGTNTSHNFYLTGVQLELGSKATPFEVRSYADELRSCERYYEAVGNFVGLSSNTPTSIDGVCSFRTTKRTGSYTVGRKGNVNISIAHPTISGHSSTAITANHKYKNYFYGNLAVSNTGQARELITIYLADDTIYIDDEI